MRSYISLFLIALISTLLFTPLAGRLATALGAVDIPDDKRRIHKKPTPRMGGLAIYAAFLLTLLCVPFLRNEIGQRFNEHPRWYISIIIATTIVFVLGVYDDLKGANAPLKIAVQIVAAGYLQFAGFGIGVVSLPFLGENYTFPMWLSFPLTALWVIGITNAFNLVDGIDGLASGISAFALVSILLASIAIGNFEIGLLAVILLGAVIGFLYHNFHPASIFLGDSGSLTLGFLIATLSLIGAQKGTTTIAIAIPLVSFGLPVVEIFLSLIRRFVGGKPLMQSDRGHIHHRLLDHGLSVRQVAILLYGVCAVFCLFGILLLNPRRSLAALVFSVLGVLIVLGVQRLRYPEFEELSNKIRKGVARRRKQIAANVSVRQMSSEIRRAQTGEKIFTLLNEICATNDFDGITLELKPQINQHIRAGLVSAAEKNGWKPARKDENNSIWGLTQTDFSVEDLLRSEHVWSLRVPLGNDQLTVGVMTLYRNFTNGDVLIDLNNICGDLQRELSEALVNLLQRPDAEAPTTNPVASFAK